MTLKAIVTEEEHGTLAEGLRGEYARQEDGSYRLSVEGVNGWVLDDTQGLRAALSAAREEAKAASRGSKAWGELDPSKVRADLQRLERLEAEDPEAKAKAQFESMREKLQDKHADELAKASARGDAFYKQLERSLVEAEAEAAIVKAGGNPLFLKHAVMGRIKPEIGEDYTVTTTVLDADGKPDITRHPGKAGPMGIEELVSTYRDSDEYAAAFKSQTKGGSGYDGSDPSSNSGGPNPFARGSFNLTKQMEMLKSDPGKAKLLQDAAASN